MRFLLRRLFTVVVGFTAAVSTAAPVTVEDILRTVKQPDVLTADFTLEKKTPAVTVMLKSRGRLVLSKEKGLLWMTTDPFEDCLGFSAVLAPMVTTKCRALLSATVEKSSFV